MSSEVNSILMRMHQHRGAGKGDYGEQAVFSICEEIYNQQTGILIHSYCYKTIPGLAGNIKKDGSKLYVEHLGGYTEIDVLLVTPFKIFPIEVKAYAANSITLTDEGISGCNVTNKSPIHQNEMHLRHLYPNIYLSIPEGDCYNYVVPIVVFVDRCTLIDKRSDRVRKYIPIAILNNLKATIAVNNVPYNNTLLDLKDLELSLRKAMISSSKFLPYVER